MSFVRYWLSAVQAERQGNYKGAYVLFLGAKALAKSLFAQGHVADAVSRCHARLVCTWRRR